VDFPGLPTGSFRRFSRSSIPVPDIAEACGFNYVEHMIPVSKKYHGSTPSRYRMNARLGK
jgi:AraC-like DNA-binding protein